MVKGLTAGQFFVSCSFKFSNFFVLFMRSRRKKGENFALKMRRQKSETRPKTLFGKWSRRSRNDGPKLPRAPKEKREEDLKSSWYLFNFPVGIKMSSQGRRKRRKSLKTNWKGRKRRRYTFFLFPRFHPLANPRKCGHPHLFLFFLLKVFSAKNEDEQEQLLAFLNDDDDACCCCRRRLIFRAI